MPTILFDLDGTLIDHFSAIHRACAHAARQIGSEEPDYATVRATVGGSVPVTLGRLFGNTEVDAAMPHFRAHFAEIMLDDLAAMPGAGWILDALDTAGFRLAVFTNKDEGSTRKLLDHLGLDRHLHSIVGTGGLPFRKPQPEFTHHALEVTGSSAAETTIVGDSPFDHQAAVVAGLAALLVATGSHSAQQLADETGNPDIYDDLYHLGVDVFGLERPRAGQP